MTTYTLGDGANGTVKVRGNERLQRFTNAELYRGYWIDYNPPPIPVRDCDWSFSHIDFDGPGDNRYGYGPSIEDCKAQIDEQIEEQRCD